ncbi:MAG: hypothetical protein IAI48_13835 [Candidatus Eremiobacteraeota bacterium]|nr:hypothetical protein [Candidatus Eremiobacteraeota bacterium]
MHNEDDEQHSAEEDTAHDAVIAADDTGMVQQQELLHEVEVNDGGERSA